MARICWHLLLGTVRRSLRSPHRMAVLVRCLQGLMLGEGSYCQKPFSWLCCITFVLFSPFQRLLVVWQEICCTTWWQSFDWRSGVFLCHPHVSSASAHAQSTSALLFPRTFFHDVNYHLVSSDCKSGFHGSIERQPISRNCSFFWVLRLSRLFWVTRA